jgi:hypothetical protein
VIFKIGVVVEVPIVILPSVFKPFPPVPEHDVVTVPAVMIKLESVVIAAEE